MRKWIVFGLLLMLALGPAACARRPAEVGAPAPSLAARLDLLFKSDRDAWRREIREHLAAGQAMLPARHLIHAVKDFNRADTAEMCLDAAYQYLYARTQEARALEGEERGLLRVYVEYVLKHPEIQPLYRLEELCRLLRDEICDALG